MARLILVHGAWHGGWVWQRLRPMLEAHGHRVSAPTLTGLGDRAGLVTPTTGLEDHVRDIVQAIGADDREPTYLVAHSYAGIPATVAADRVPERVRGVIYIDARVPRHGQRGFDVWPGSETLFRESSKHAGDGWLIPPPDETFGIRSATDLAWVKARLTPHPLRTYEDRVLFRSGQPAVPSAAVVCVGDGSGERIVVADAIPSVQIVAGHDAMVSDVEVLFEALLSMIDRI